MIRKKSVLSDPNQVVKTLRDRLAEQLWRNKRLASRVHTLEKSGENSRSEVAASRGAVIFGMAKLAESRDDDTGLHLERICQYTQVLAQHLSEKDPDLDEQWVKNMTETAALHDIGKVATPDAVLLKPGKLTPDERRIIEKHPYTGGDRLIELKQRWGNDPFLVTAAEIALAHHEKWDGTGYPFGLKAETIPFSARIVALADVYDALTSKRIYKPSLTHNQAQKIIIAGSGTHFDPKVVTAFLAVEKKFETIASEMRSTSELRKD